MTLLEPDVSLTDFGLAIECALFVVWLQRQSTAPFRIAFMAFFFAVGVAALLGGVTHGFLPDPQSWTFRIVWRGTLLAIGLAALASWSIGARLCLSDAGAGRITVFAAAIFAVYAVVVLFVSQSFLVAIAFYLPAAAFLLIAFVIAYRRWPSSFLRAGIAGVLLTFVAAGVQQAEISLHPSYFNHNALYHLIQAIGLFLIFWAGRGLVRLQS